MSGILRWVASQNKRRGRVLPDQIRGQAGAKSGAADGKMLPMLLRVRIVRLGSDTDHRCAVG